MERKEKLEKLLYKALDQMIDSGHGFTELQQLVCNILDTLNKEYGTDFIARKK